MKKQVYYSLIPSTGRVGYGYKSINERAIPDSKRHLWSFYPFVIRLGNNYYYKIREKGFTVMTEDDFVLVSKKIDSFPEQWELYGLKPIYEKGVCLPRCTVLRRLRYIFFEPNKLDFMEYITPSEPDREPEL